MQETIGWLERPLKKIGLDNLGAQQPCVTIYTRLLPGITNVTDRAAYFGFYPWFIRAFEARHPEASETQFRETLRLADCLMTLVAERHAIACGEDIARHSATCPGRLTLGPVARDLQPGQTVELGRYADRSESNPTRYFKNPLGGLGQYYLGVLRDEYTVLHGDPRKGIGYWLERGAPLADAYGAGLDGDLFFAALEAGAVTLGDLDDLAIFCPCSLQFAARKPAQTALISLFLRDRSPHGVARASSLALVLDYLKQRNGAPTDDPIKDFLASCYTEALPEGPWATPERLLQARRGWALYARNEMLSLAWSALFKNALDALDGHPKPFANIDALAAWLVTTPAFQDRPAATFNDLVAADFANAPALDAIAHPEHELAMWRALLAANPPSPGEAARLLVRLYRRWLDEPSDAYRELNLPPGTLSGYPLTLNSLRAMATTRWAGLAADGWFRVLVSDVLVTHQRIAIRKMGQSGEDTLMFRSGDLGFFVHRDLERIVETQPRLRQAFQILRDLGLTTHETEHLPHPTALGDQALQELVG
ncbi:hypothetical protein [Sediminicoccus sp. KRV36]|uniref:hypothetical protein n=1 Tax=Sediminicoccus sp. KRV36 TaxID=3133721 RepID=UPI00200D06D8|nr:hypothetical protein [Sediminicoccus rosea]UPY35080.1 hypothetical protein LHU95_12630 [Sediminicoccus rosea]